MEYRYKSVHCYGEDNFEEKKSKFIGYAKAVKTQEEAEEFIQEIKELHNTATHNCTAYVINDNLKRFSDDGEPTHTAGMPMLTTLEQEGLKEVVVVVTRYFGGTLLGKGGLVRAYTQGCKLALDKAIIVDKVLHKIIEIEFSYESIGILDNYLITNKIMILDKKYEDLVKYTIYSDSESEEKTKQDLLDLTSANINWRIIDEVYLSVKNGKIIKEK